VPAIFEVGDDAFDDEDSDVEANREQDQIPSFR
jgi:hypothetical protein